MARANPSVVRLNVRVAHRGGQVRMSKELLSKQPDGRWLLARDARTLSPVGS